MENEITKVVIELFPDAVPAIACVHCGTTREHVEMMALFAGIQDPFCCDTTW